MDVERWQRIKQLVGDALDRPAAERRGWLANACADRPDLVPDVLTLIDAAQVTGGFLQPAQPAIRGDRRAPTPRRKPGQKIGHYELAEWIGAGGMGEVFRGRDLALGRDAALKLLPVNFDDDLRRRLVHEAEASARLQHPGIATFYEAGEADGETFIAMEFVRGLTLRARLREGPLPADEALAMTCCLLEALAHAHAAGLLHRDIKPENVILTGAGSAKLLDFSIALAMTAESDAHRTRSSESIATAHDGLAGTIGYLAPEQLTGDPLDARTDLFQVAAVLYEAITGTPAFGNASVLDRLAALMTAEADFANLETVHHGLAHVVRRALARNPAQRFASAADFLRALHDLTDGHLLAAGPRVVAIADFENRSGDDRIDWLGAALAESVATFLAKAPDIALIPRHRWLHALAASASGPRGDARAISLGLGCGSVVEGQFDRSNNLLRIDASVVDVATGAVVATEHVHGELSTLFTLQDQLAHAIAAHVQAGGTIPRHRRETAVEAHEYYTRARVLIDGFGKGSLEDACDLLERAVTIDPRHADALAALTTACGLRAIASPTPALYQAAVDFAERAIAIDPHHVRAHVWKGYALAGLGRLEEADHALARALELNPTDTDGLYFSAASALLWRVPPRPSHAAALAQRALDVDPNHGMWWLALGTAHRCLGALSEARYCFSRARALEGTRARLGTAGAAAYVAEVLRREGRLDEARTEALAGIEAAERSDHAYRDTFRAHGLTVLGRVSLDRKDIAAADAAFRQVLAQAKGRPRPRAFGHLVVQALCGLARATGDENFLLEGRRLYEVRETYNFERFYGALDEDTLSDLAHAAAVLGT